jgi:hypothetical protein
MRAAVLGLPTRGINSAPEPPISTTLTDVTVRVALGPALGAVTTQDAQALLRHARYSRPNGTAVCISPRLRRSSRRAGRSSSASEARSSMRICSSSPPWP